MSSDKINIVDYNALGKRICEYRTAKCWSQQILSEKCDITPTYISHIERAVTKPSLNTIVKIANALDIGVDQLLCDSLQDAGTTAIKNRIYNVLDDCTDREVRILQELLESSKTIIRKHGKL